MKPLITGIALLLIFSTIVLFEVDNHDMRMKNIEIKNTADEASASASCFYDGSLFACKEKKIFNEKDGLQIINRITETYKLSRNIEEIDRYVCFFNDNGICNIYKNDVKIHSFHFDYPYVYKDSNMNFLKTVGQASVIVTLDAGSAKYHLNVLTSPKIMRSSGYEYVR